MTNTIRSSGPSALVTVATSFDALGVARFALMAALVAAFALSAGAARAAAATPAPPPDRKVAPAAKAPAAAPPVATAPAGKAPAARVPAADEQKVQARPGRVLPWYERLLPAPALAKKMPFRSGEHILFKLRILGKEAGWGEARIGRRTTRAGHRVYALEALVRSTGVFDKVYPVHDELKSWLDTATATPIEAALTLKENKSERDVALWFGGAHFGRIKGHQVKGDKREKVDDRSPLRALDPLSAFYHMRARELAAGDTFSMFVHNGIRLYRVDVKVSGEEKVWTDVGMLPAWKLVARAQRADGTRASWHQDMTFWLSTDSLRLPVKMSFDLAIGTVDATLAGLKGVKGRRDLAPKAAAAPAPAPKAAAAAPAPAPAHAAAP